MEFLKTQTDHQILARQPHLVLTRKKEIFHLVDFAVPADHRVKMKIKKTKR